MSPKTLNILYWTATALFALLLLGDGVGGLMRAQAGAEVLNHLGYPLYVMSILGAAKIAGAAAILQPRYALLREWAYAGFALSCYGAFTSRLAVGDSGLDLAFPIIFFAIMLIPYSLGKMRESAAATPA